VTGWSRLSRRAARRSLRGSRRPEAGSATALATVLVGLLGVVAAVVAVLGGAVADQRRAASAADLAALAGAQAVQHGDDGCLAAGVVAHRNGATVAGCRLEGEVVVLRVTRPARWFLGRRVRASSSARAGPVP